MPPAGTRASAGRGTAAGENGLAAFPGHPGRIRSGRVPKDDVVSRSPPPGLHQALIEHGAWSMLVVDRAGRVVQASPAARRLLGADPTGRPLADLAEATAADTLSAYLSALAAREPGPTPGAASAHAVVDLRHRDGRVLAVQLQGVNLLGVAPVHGLALTLFDISAFRERETALQDSLSRDPLTGLPNRQRFAFHVDEIQAGGRGVCVALVDLDQFKAINDTYGHLVGDEILRSVGRRLEAAMPAGGAVLRFGGDEFGLLLPGSADDTMLDTIESVRRQASAPLAIGNVIVSVGLSIGVTQLDGYRLDEALRECDVAMYAAKVLGRGRVARYGDEARAVLEAQESLAARVDQLIEHNQKLHSEARTDALTGLANRRALAEIEAVRVGDVASAWSTCSVLFVDVDHFGRFNKRYGDPAGDQALRTLATALRTVARGDDLVFRKGGEEFVVVLPNLDRRAGVGVAERMRAQVQALGIEHAEGTEAGVLTVSVTVCGVRAGTTVGDALARAGNAAMASKAADQRNAVTLGD